MNEERFLNFVKGLDVPNISPEEALEYFQRRKRLAIDAFNNMIKNSCETTDLMNHYIGEIKTCNDNIKIIKNRIYFSDKI